MANEIQTNTEKNIFIKSRVFTLVVITAVAFIITALAVSFMPDTVPMHYNAKGMIDRYGSKYENFLFPFIILLFNLFWYVLIAAFKRKALKTDDDKKREELKSNINVLGLAAVGTSLLFVLMQCMFLAADILSNDKNFNFDFNNITTVISAAIGVSLIFLGNIMPKSKRNSLVGLRIVWSMANDKTWSLSNRFAGKAMIVAGLVVIFESLLIGGITAELLIIPIVLIVTIISVVYSYKVYQKYGKLDDI